MTRALGYIPRNGRRDDNERTVIDALHAAGAWVQGIGQPGCPDLLVGFRRVWYALEVKGPKGTLTPRQKAFFLVCEQMELPVAVVRSPLEALRAIGAIPKESP